MVGILDSTKTVTAVYHAQCEILINCLQERCSNCATYRKSLSAMVSRTSKQKDDRTRIMYIIINFVITHIHRLLN